MVLPLPKNASKDSCEWVSKKFLHLVDLFEVDLRAYGTVLAGDTHGSRMRVWLLGLLEYEELGGNHPPDSEE